jgi:hypothetical protein
MGTLDSAPYRHTRSTSSADRREKRCCRLQGQESVTVREICQHASNLSSEKNMSGEFQKVPWPKGFIRPASDRSLPWYLENLALADRVVIRSGACL